MPRLLETAQAVPDAWLEADCLASEFTQTLKSLVKVVWREDRDSQHISHADSPVAETGGNLIPGYESAAFSRTTVPGFRDAIPSATGC
jgi:hypothetical protein